MSICRPARRSAGSARSPCRAPAVRPPAGPARRGARATRDCLRSRPDWQEAVFVLPLCRRRTRERRQPPRCALSALFGVRCRKPVDQRVQGFLDLVDVASHQDSVLQRIGAEGFDLLDVLVQNFDLFEAGHRLAIGLPPHRRRLGLAGFHCFVPPNTNLAINSVSGMESWVLAISPPAAIIFLSAPGSSTTPMPPSSDSLTILALVSVGSWIFDVSEMWTTAC